MLQARRIYLPRRRILLNQSPQNLTVATTGASGSIFLRQLLFAVERDERVKHVNFIASDSGLRVLAEELAVRGRSNLVRQILGTENGSSKSLKGKNSKTSSVDSANSSKIEIPKIQSSKIQISKIQISKIKEQCNADIGANVASGSYPADAMVVIPCSVGTLARIANGIASHLIERAADVCLKEKHPLVLCVRETPLNKIHIRNMYRAADAGATIFPLIPAFYYRPASLDDIAREFAYRVLAHLGLAQTEAFQWKA